MKLDPITTDDPTNHDLLKMIVQVHECVEDGKTIAKRGLRGATKAAHAAALAAKTAVTASESAASLAAEAATKAAKASGDIVSIREALGITDGQKPVAGLSSPWKSFLRSAGATATAITGLLLLYRFAVAMGPSAWDFLGNLNHAILSGKF